MLERANVVIEVEDLSTWEEHTWSVLGRTESGWLESDEEYWDNAIEIFRETLRQQEGVEILENGRSARLTCWAWLAIAEKG